MRIIVDADATPNISLITKIAEENKIPLFLYCDDSHEINNDYAKIIVLSRGYQTVDTKISNDLKQNDILITQDYGLALIGLSKKSYVINPKGFYYTEDNINLLLFERQLNLINRKKKIKTKNMKKRTKEEDKKLRECLLKIIKKF